MSEPARDQEHGEGREPPQVSGFAARSPSAPYTEAVQPGVAAAVELASRPGLLSRLLRWLSWETLKTLVEIVAIVVAGGWAFFEYGLKEREARLSGAHLHRATLALSSSAAELRDGSHWLLSRLTITNPSKRVVRTFLVSWWYEYPPRPEDPDRSTAVKNDPRTFSLAPGESSEIQVRKLIKPSEEAVLVHAHVIFLDAADGLQCRIHPEQVLPAGGLKALPDQPKVCSALPGSEGCAKPGCESQSAEALVSLTRAPQSDE
jgi:hypothetical protein